MLLKPFIKVSSLLPPRVIYSSIFIFFFPIQNKNKRAIFVFTVKNKINVQYSVSQWKIFQLWTSSTIACPDILSSGFFILEKLRRGMSSVYESQVVLGDWKRARNNITNNNNNNNKPATPPQEEAFGLWSSFFFFFKLGSLICFKWSPNWYQIFRNLI